MNKPEKAGTDDLKRMLRRLERIETEKAERAQARANGPVRTRDLSALPAGKRRPDNVPPDLPAEPSQSSRRTSLVASLHQHAPELPIPATAAPRLVDEFGEKRADAERKRVSVLTDPREFTKHGGPKREGVSAPFVVGVVAIAFVATLGTIWLTGGFDRVFEQYAPQSSAKTGNPADAAPNETVVAASAPPSRFVGDRIAPDDTPPVETAETAPAQVLSPSPVEAADGDADAVAGDNGADSSAADTTTQTTPAVVSSSSSDASADIGPPPAPVAALQSPQEAPPSPPSTPVAPGSIELVSPGSVAAEPGVPFSFPVSLEAGSGDLSGYYLVVSGLKKGSSFSDGIELLFHTWQIPATAVSGLQLTTMPGFARRMHLNVELRGPLGDALKRTTLTVELPGAARAAVGLDGAGADGDRAPSQSAQELIDKAEVFLDNDSLQGARLLLERAAAQGAGYAAMLLATSYDPRYAKSFSAEHPDPDAAQAKRWYERAFELGVGAAGERLNSADGR